MRPTMFMLTTGAMLALACGDADQGSLYDQLATDEDFAEGEAVPPVEVPEELVPLECPQGGSTGPIRVEFDCTEITITTCKDLSNVVIEFEDGSRQRFEGLKGHHNAFTGAAAQQGAIITGVWVKAGNNKSGDGPGYGERFDAPYETCTPPAPPPQPPQPPPDEDECGGFDYGCAPGTPGKPAEPTEPPIGI